MDVSGTNDNYQYLGIIIAEKNNIDALYKRMGSPTTHMSGLPKQTKQRIISKLQFDQNYRFALCVKIDRKRIIQEVKNRRITKYKRMSNGRLFAMFEKALFKYLRHDIENFTLKHHLELGEVPVECDNDSKVFAKVWGSNTISPHATHFIADALAWCNNKNIRIDTSIELNYTDEIKMDMIRKLQK